MKSIPLLLVTALFAMGQAQARPMYVTLSPNGAQTIGLTSVPVARRALIDQRTLYGYFVVPPNREALVMPRIRGRVSALYATVGTFVHRGARLARIESLLVGNPPPSVIVHAPENGVIEERPVLLGQSVTPKTVLFHLIAPQVLWLQAHAYQDEIAGLAIGQQARIQPLGFQHAQFRGQIVQISPRINPRSGTETIWIAVANAKNQLRPRLFAKAHVVLRTIQAATVPESAILAVNNQQAVFVVTSNNRFRYVPITTGVTEQGYTEVFGVPVDARVVTRGNGELYTLWITGGKLKADS